MFHFIVMFWLKASVSMNMLYMVVTAPVSKPWMFCVTFWLKAFASHIINMQDMPMVVTAPVWETNTREAWRRIIFVS